MESKEHQGKTLRYLTVEPDGYDPNKKYPLVILLHGYGASMGDLAGLSPAIDPTGYVYAFPNAPLSVEVGFGTTGYAWIPPRDSGSPQDAQNSVEMLATFVEEVMEQFQVEPPNALLGGFSQGGMMTYRYGMTNPHLFSGLAALSSSVRDPEGLKEQLPESRDIPIFVTHGTSDQMISVSDARASKSFLEAEGYKPVYKEYQMGHEINQDVLDDFVPWLHEVLPPA